MQRPVVPPWLSRIELDPGPGIAPFWQGIAVLLGFREKAPPQDGPVSLTMMRHARLRKAALSILPWGVFTGAAHGWSEITQVVHETVETGKGQTHLGWPKRTSFLYVDIGSERFQAAREWHPQLAELGKLARTFALESERLVALGLAPSDGLVEPDSGETLKVLLRAAQDLLRSDRGRELFDVEAFGYRSTTRRVRPASLQLLREMLVGPCQGPDRAPLACVIAAELGAIDLVDDLALVASSPSPIAAAIARAAITRLGETRPFRRHRELGAFLDEDEARLCASWARGGGRLSSTQPSARLTWFSEGAA